MVGTRAGRAAALMVTATLVATAAAPAIVTLRGATSQASASDSATALPTVLPTAIAAPAVVDLPATPSPGIAAGPHATTEPAPLADPTDAPVVQPSCEPAPAGVSAAPVAWHGSRDRKVVALTFDDGYNPTNTLRILDELRQAKVNATFFVTGRAVQLFPGLWREVAAAGFPIADHTYDHHALAGLCFATQLRELTRQADAVRAALGADPVALMRPPYGSKDRDTLLAATAAGDRAVVLWDIDTRDWSGLGAAGIATRALAGGRGSIVLMHTLYATTAAALPRIIAGYRARGFQFVTVGELLGVPGPVPFD